MKKENNKDFACRLKKFRIKAKLTQKELADSIGVSRCSISNWESSGTYKTTSTKYLLRMANILQVDPILLIYDKENIQYSGKCGGIENEKVCEMPVYKLKNIRDSDMKFNAKFVDNFKKGTAPNKDCFMIKIPLLDKSMVNPGLGKNFPPGTLVAIDPRKKKIKKSSFVLAYVGNKAIFRLFEKSKNGPILRALNPQAGETDFDEKAGDIILGVAYEKIESL